MDFSYYLGYKMSENLFDHLDVRFRDQKIVSDEIEYLPARKLITDKRIDIAVKYKYVEAFIENKEHDLAFYRELYISTIYFFSCGQFTEPGTDLKNSEKDFVKFFDETIVSIKKNGFDISKGIIPLSKYGTPLDGAHRIAIAAYFNIDVAVIKLDADCLDCSLNFFRQRGATEQQLKYYLQSLTRVNPQVRLAIVWPYANISSNKLKEMYGEDYIASFDYYLDKNGVANLCLLSYHKEHWLGTSANNWSGVTAKSDACYSPAKTTKVIFYLTRGLDKDIALKERIRSLNDGSKHIIHSTDDIIETNSLANILLYKYGEPILNNLSRIKLAKIKKSIETVEKNEAVDLKDAVITGSALGAILSLRENQDIDIITGSKFTLASNLIGFHNEYQSLYELNAITITNDETCFIKLLGTKLIDVDLWIHFKSRRGEAKDIDDLRAMRKMISGGSAYSLLGILKANISVALRKHGAKTKVQIISLLKYFGLYKIIKKALKNE